MPKYSPQLPILKHPQPTFLSQCQRPSFTLIFLPLLAQGPHLNGRKICGPRKRFTKQSVHIIARHTKVSLPKLTEDNFYLFMIYGLIIIIIIIIIYLFTPEYL